MAVLSILGASGSQWPDDADLACLYSFSGWVNNATVQIKCSSKKEKTEPIDWGLLLGDLKGAYP